MATANQRTAGRHNADASTPAGKQPAEGGTNESGQSTPPMPPGRAWIVFLLILAANYLLVRLFFPGPDAPVVVPYTLFKAQVTSGNVEAIYSRGERITGRFEAPVTYLAKQDSISGQQPREVTTFETILPAFIDPGLEALLTDNEVEISAEPIQEGNLWTTLLFSFAPALLLIGLYVWFYRRVAKQGGLGGGMLGIGRSTARRFDKALLRPGRFDRRVVVNLPDRNGREAILEVHTRRVPLAPDVSLGEIAAAKPGLSGADIRNLVNEAALLAARREQDAVHQKDFLDALEKIVLGPERPLLLSHADRERIAYHEGGHAILGLVVPGADPVHRVTIVPRGQALGVTYQRPDSDRYNYPEAYLRARIVGMLGGRAAEEIVYGTKTTGAENDIEQATRLARAMVTRWGMSERLGMVQLAPRENPYLAGQPGLGSPQAFSEETARAIDAEVLQIIAESHEEAKRLLSEHRGALDALAEALLVRETLDEQEILEVTGLPPAPALETHRLPA